MPALMTINIQQQKEQKQKDLEKKLFEEFKKDRQRQFIKKYSQNVLERNQFQNEVMEKKDLGNFPWWTDQNRIAGSSQPKKLDKHDTVDCKAKHQQSKNCEVNIRNIFADVSEKNSKWLEGIQKSTQEDLLRFKNNPKSKQKRIKEQKEKIQQSKKPYKYLRKSNKNEELEGNNNQPKDPKALARGQAALQQERSEQLQKQEKQKKIQKQLQDLDNQRKNIIDNTRKIPFEPDGDQSMRGFTETNSRDQSQHNKSRSSHHSNSQQQLGKKLSRPQSRSLSRANDDQQQPQRQARSQSRNKSQDRGYQPSTRSVSGKVKNKDKNNENVLGLIEEQKDKANAKQQQDDNKKADSNVDDSKQQKKKYKTTKQVDADEQMRVMQAGEFADYKKKNEQDKKTIEQNIKNRDITLGGKVQTQEQQFPGQNPNQPQGLPEDFIKNMIQNAQLMDMPPALVSAKVADPFNLEEYHKKVETQIKQQIAQKKEQQKRDKIIVKKNFNYKAVNPTIPPMELRKRAEWEKQLLAVSRLVEPDLNAIYKQPMRGEDFGEKMDEDQVQFLKGVDAFWSDLKDQGRKQQLEYDSDGNDSDIYIKENKAKKIRARLNSDDQDKDNDQDVLDRINNQISKQVDQRVQQGLSRRVQIKDHGSNSNRQIRDKNKKSWSPDKKKKNDDSDDDQILDRMKRFRMEFDPEYDKVFQMDANDIMNMQQFDV